MQFKIGTKFTPKDLLLKHNVEYCQDNLIQKNTQAVIVSIKQDRNKQHYYTLQILSSGIKNWGNADHINRYWKIYDPSASNHKLTRIFMPDKKININKRGEE